MYRYEDLPAFMNRMTGDEKHASSATSILDVLWMLYDRVLWVTPPMGSTSPGCVRAPTDSCAAVGERLGDVPPTELQPNVRKMPCRYCFVRYRVNR